MPAQSQGFVVQTDSEFPEWKDDTVAHDPLLAFSFFPDISFSEECRKEMLKRFLSSQILFDSSFLLTKCK